MMNKLLAIVNTVLANRGRIQVQQLQPSDSLRDDLGLDSLDLAELTVRIEAQYDVDIFEDGIVTTIGEILERLENN